MAENVMVFRGRGRRARPDAEGKVVQLLARSRKLEGILVTLEPGSDFGRSYSHPGEEIRYVLEGEVEFDIGGRKYHLKKGDCIWHGSELPHALRNPGKKRSSYFVVVLPPSFS